MTEKKLLDVLDKLATQTIHIEQNAADAHAVAKEAIGLAEDAEVAGKRLQVLLGELIDALEEEGVP